MFYTIRMAVVVVTVRGTENEPIRVKVGWRKKETANVATVPLFRFSMFRYCRNVGILLELFRE